MRALFCLTICLFCLLTSHVKAEDFFSHDSEDAVHLAVSYLEQLDDGNANQVWLSGTPIFRTRYSQNDWVRLQDTLHQIYGPTVSRDLQAINVKDTLLMSPDGRYIVAQFKTSFEHKRNAIETVILDVNNPSDWRLTDLRIN